jgi:streptogramin lyase
MGTDKNADVLWVGNSWGATLAGIDTKTLQTTIIPFPDPSYQPYYIAVDQNHNVWGNLWTADRIAKYDPGKGQWTMFDLPTRGTESAISRRSSAMASPRSSCRSIATARWAS